MAIALVTGSSSGIGKLSALELARRGHRVYASMRNLERATDIRTEAVREGLTVEVIEVIQLDVTDEASVNAAVASVVDREGRLDILVNNAGIGTFAPVEYYTDAEIRHVFETNFLGAIRGPAQHCRRCAQHSGTIIMISSISGLRTFPFGAVYSASKFALEAISNGLRYELKPFGIRVSLVEPGNFKTRAGENMYYPSRLISSDEESLRDPLYTQTIEHQVQGIKKAVLGDAHDVARVVADAAGADNPHVRYVVGDAEAHRVLGLGADDFEKMISARTELRASS